MATSKSQDSNDTQELAARHNGTSISRESIQATMEYNVVIEQETVGELPDHMDAAEFAENIAASRMDAELDPTFSINPSDAMAGENESYIMNDERHFTVFVRVSQND